MLVFHNIYEKNILPEIADFEQTRKLYVKDLIITEVFLLVIICLSLFAYYQLTQYFAPALITVVVSITAFSVAIIMPFSINAKFLREFKSQAVPKIVNCFGNVSYLNVSDISDKIIEKSMIIPKYHTRIDDDCFKGKYKNVVYNVAEAAFIGGHGKYTYTFSAVMLLMKFNKPIGAKTIVGEKEIFKEICGYPIKPQKHGLKEIKLEDVEFAKRYLAFSTDEVGGRYLLTTAFIERFNHLKNIMGGKNARCSFFDDCVMFVIPTFRNRFEIANLFCRLDNPKKYLQFYKEISSILEVIDYFKLDEKTGL